MTTQRKRQAHKCSARGRRTYRRHRRFPSLGTVDARCTICAERGFMPEQAEHKGGRR